MTEIINGETIEEGIEREYSKGRGNMNLPPSKNLAEEFYQKGIKEHPEMDEERRKHFRTQCLLATDVEEMSQLVDRLSSNNFQG